MSIATIVGCSTDPSQDSSAPSPSSSTSSEKQLFVESVNKSFDLNKKSERIKAGFSLLSDRDKKISKIISSDFQRFIPKKGNPFDAIKIVFIKNNETITRVIPVKSDPSSGNNKLVTMVGCAMECKASFTCKGCDMTVEEECKKLSCNCNEGSGDCTPKITT